MKTINKIKQHLGVPDSILNMLTNLPTVDLINERIIVSLIIGIESNISTLQFCDLLEILVDGEHSKGVIEVLRNGNLHK